MKEKLIQLLDSQNLSDELQDSFIEGVKEIKKLAGNNPIIFEIEGEMYELRKERYETRTVELGRKHGGFYHDYRIVKIGKPVT